MVGGGLSLRVVLCLAFVLCLALPQLPAQDSDSASPANSAPTDGQSANPQDAQSEQRETPPAQNDSIAPATKPTGENFAQPGPALQQTPPLPGQQPRRILGLMPNFRAVSAGATPPPPTPKQNLIIATKNSFDYSALPQPNSNSRCDRAEIRVRLRP